MTELDVKLFNQLMRLFVMPEISTRRKAGSLPSEYNPQTIQIVFYPDERETEVRFDLEAKFGWIVQKKSKVPDLGEGDILKSEDIAFIEALEPDEKELGHAMFTTFNHSFLMALNFGDDPSKFIKANPQISKDEAKDLLAMIKQMEEDGYRSNQAIMVRKQ